MNQQRGYRMKIFHSGIFSGNLMAIQWSFVVIKLSFDSNSIVIRLIFSDNSMVIRLTFSGNSMVIRLTFDGNSIVIQCNALHNNFASL